MKEKNILIYSALGIVILILLSIVIYQNLNGKMARQDASVNLDVGTDEQGKSKSKNAAHKGKSHNTNISQKPSGPADLKSIPPEQLEEPVKGAAEVSLDENNNPVVDQQGNPVVK